MQILLVEYDALIQELVLEAVWDEGYQVISASTGEEALTWCKPKAADVLVTDIKLPGKIDGWQVESTILTCL